MIEKGDADAVLSVSYHEGREDVLFYTAEQREFARSMRVPRDYLWLCEYVFFADRRRATLFADPSYAHIRERGWRVALNAGYTYEPALFAADLSTVAFASPEKAFQALLAGEVDLFLFPRDVGTALAARLGVEERIVCLPERAFVKSYLLGFSRRSGFPGMEAFAARFHDEVRSLRESGQYESLAARHLEDRAQPPLRPLLFVCEEWKPFEYTDGGIVRGLDVEVVGRIMSRLSIPYEIRIYPWSRAWLMVTNGRADAVLSVSYSPAREDLLHYTEEQRRHADGGELPPDYLWLSEYRWFAKKSRAEDLRVESYEALRAAGLRVGLNRGYTYAPSFPAARLNGTFFNNTRDGFLALVADRIDLYPMDRTVGLAEVQALGLADSVVCLPPVLFRKPYLAPFARRSGYPDIEEVMAAFNRELRELRASGSYERIRERFLDSSAVPVP
jgi:polar amino acid transport system substrate-binding protein